MRRERGREVPEKLAWLASYCRRRAAGASQSGVVCDEDPESVRNRKTVEQSGRKAAQPPTLSFTNYILYRTYCFAGPKNN